MYNLIGMPKNFLLGFGRVSADNSLRNAFFFLADIRLSRTVMEAPVYSASPGGRFFVAEQEANKMINTASKQ
jgi:hypothetical protein